MAVVTARRAVADGEGGTLRQVVKLQRGMYGVLLARYTMPRLVQKYQSNEQEEKMFLSFLVTHDRTNAQLPHFSEAFVGIRPTLFYDPKTGKMSNYVAVVWALTGGKVPREQIAPQDQTVVPYEIDWDTLVGRPGLALVEPANKANKNGLYENHLKSIEPPDQSLQRAIKPVWDDKEIGKNKDGLAFLIHPTPAYEEDVQGSSSPGVPYDDGGADEIPF